MKRVILLVMGITSLLFSQTPSLLWERAFVYGPGNNLDQAMGLAIDGNNNIFASGFYSIPGKIRSAIKQFDANGNEGFTFMDTTSYTWSTSLSNQIATLENGNVVFITNYEYIQPMKFSMIVINPSGVEMKRIDVQPYMQITSVGDTVVGAGQGSEIVFYGPEGNILRKFPVGESVHGNVTVRISGDYVFLIALYYSPYSGWPNTFIIKYDRYTGKVIWRVNIPNGGRSFGNVDSQGNIFVGSTIQVDQLQKFSLRKLDLNGQKVWEKEWWGRSEGGESNTVNSVNAAAVTDISGQVILGGDIQKDSVNTGRAMSYIKSFSTTNGDSLWEKRWVYDNKALINHVMALKFDKIGNLLVFGNTYTNPNGTPPNQCFLTKYRFDGVGVDPTKSIPTSFTLSQNYPNPFNPSTVIRFSVTKPSFVILKVYDVLGREIKTLVDEEKPAGTYEVTFNASTLPSGVYVYRLQAGTFIETKKMVLMK